MTTTDYQHMIAITNRHFFDNIENYKKQIDKITKLGIDTIILREKDLSDAVYTELAVDIQKICKRNHTPLTIQHNIELAIKLGCKRIHLSLDELKKINENKQTIDILIISTSIHSLEDAQLAYQLGASYLIAGNIYETECKKGLPGRGLSFLSEICNAVPIPVYAIGGITPERLPLIRQAGAKGGCMMSGFMLF